MTMAPHMTTKIERQ